MSTRVPPLRRAPFSRVRVCVGSLNPLGRIYDGAGSSRTVRCRRPGGDDRKEERKAESATQEKKAAEARAAYKHFTSVV